MNDHFPQVVGGHPLLSSAMDGAKELVKLRDAPSDRPSLTRFGFGAQVRPVWNRSCV